MPTFRQSPPASISTSVASLLASSPNLSAQDVAHIGQAASAANYHDVLAERERFKLQEARAAAAAREDPARIAEVAGIGAGITDPRAQMQLYGSQRNMLAPQPVKADEEGNPLPPAPYQRPEGVTPDQETIFNRAVQAIRGQALATAPSNIHQVTGAMGDLQKQSITDRIAAEMDPAKRLPLQQAAHPALLPYGNMSPEGTVTSHATGATTMVDKDVHDAAVQRKLSQATASEAQAGLAGARKTQVGQPPPAKPTPPETPRSIQQQEKLSEETRKLKLENDEKEAKAMARRKAMAQRKFGADTNPKLKGTHLGPTWVPGQGLQVLDKNNQPVPGLYY